MHMIFNIIILLAIIMGYSQLDTAIFGIDALQVGPWWLLALFFVGKRVTKITNDQIEHEEVS